jgi:hypothetical protein
MSGLEAFIMKMRHLGDVEGELARIAARAVEEAARANVSAGLAPDGTPWPAKKDGSKALKNGAAAVHAVATGSGVLLSVEGVEAYHQRYREGAAHPRRQLIPDQGDPIPEYIDRALGAAVDETVSKVLG